MAELIVALDVQSRAAAVEKVKAIGDAVDFYKIGLELFTAEGPDVVKAVKDLGKRVFLDLKFHDIPRTVERAVRSGGKLGVDLMTIHSVGAKAMIEAARTAADEFGPNGPKILAVTVLTSLDQADLADVGIVGRTPAEQVQALSVTAISGLGSVAHWREHAVDTARAVSEMKPDYLGLLTLMVEPGTPLEKWVREGSFTLLSPLEVLKETELFLQHVDSEGTVFRANHASNYLTLKGTLNGDRDALLGQIAAALEGRRDLKPEFLRAL